MGHDGAVSVPLRGLWFLSAKLVPWQLNDGFIIRRFRPLTGIVVLISSSRTTSWNLATRFRPLTGIMVLIGPGGYFCWKLFCSFRPLTGIMVLIDATYFDMDEFDELFPSPYGDYSSYPHPL